VILAAGVDQSQDHLADLALLPDGVLGDVLLLLHSGRVLGGTWRQRIARFPLFLALSIGMSVHNSRAGTRGVDRQAEPVRAYAEVSCYEPGEEQRPAGATGAARHGGLVAEFALVRRARSRGLVLAIHYRQFGAGAVPPAVWRRLREWFGMYSLTHLRLRLAEAAHDRGAGGLPSRSRLAQGSGRSGRAGATGPLWRTRLAGRDLDPPWLVGNVMTHSTTTVEWQLEQLPVGADVMIKGRARAFGGPGQRSMLTGCRSAVLAASRYRLLTGAAGRWWC